MIVFFLGAKRRVCKLKPNPSYPLALSNFVLATKGVWQWVAGNFGSDLYRGGSHPCALKPPNLTHHWAVAEVAPPPHPL